MIGECLERLGVKPVPAAEESCHLADTCNGQLKSTSHYVVKVELSSGVRSAQ
jgi:hypothetical protein